MADKKVAIKLSEMTKIILDIPLYQEAPKSWLDNIKVSGCTGYSLSGDAFYGGKVIEDNIQIVKRNSKSVTVSGDIIGVVDVKENFLKYFISNIEDSSMLLSGLTFLLEDEKYVTFAGDEEGSPIEGVKISIIQGKKKTIKEDKGFNERELEINNSNNLKEKYCAYKDLADEIYATGDLDWSNKVQKKAFKFVEYAEEWWDDFPSIAESLKNDKITLKRLFEKWEINVKENRFNGECYVEKDDLYNSLIDNLKEYIGDKEWIDKIKYEQENSYTVESLKGPFGTSRYGDGCVVYMFNKQLDSNGIDQVIFYAYDSFVMTDDGEIDRDWAEYDPSLLETKMIGTVEDEVKLTELVKRIDSDNTDLEKSEIFLRKEVLEKDIPLIFIDDKNKTIFQINDQSISSILDKYKGDLSILIREYDQVGDY